MATFTITELSRLRALAELMGFAPFYNEEQGWARTAYAQGTQLVRAQIVAKGERWHVTVGEEFSAVYGEAASALRAAFNRLADLTQE